MADHEEDEFMSGSSEEEDDQFEDAAPCSPDNDPTKDKGCMEHGCDHYKRRCKLVAPCCGEVFWCRHCHNQVKDDSEQDAAKRHTMDRKQVREVVCALCDTRQPVAASCSSCGVGFGRYVCLQCNFFDDTVSKEQFHCDECGICRVGGRANFFHCSTCNCCYSTSLQGSHICVSNSMHQNCPVCCEFLFDSIRPIAVLPCGHTIHQECHREMMSHNTITCPLCLKCILSQGDAQRYWALLDQQVRDTPMPEEYKHVQVNILCNDCSARSDVLFHVVGHKCSGCGGYNTRRIGVQEPAAAAAAPPAAPPAAS